MFVKTEFVASEYSVTVSHVWTTGEPGRTGKGVVVTEADVTPDTLTTIDVQLPQEIRSVYLLWKQEQSSMNLSVLYVPETSTLFLGVGTVAAAVDMQSMRIVQQHKAYLVWRFQHAPNSVLELGELECRLYRRNGEHLGSALVDPPYEVNYRDREVEFVSQSCGTQRIRYPL